VHNTGYFFYFLFLLFSLVTILDISLCYFITDFSQSTSGNLLTAFVAVQLTYVPHFGFHLFHAIFIPSYSDDHSHIEIILDNYV
jgi:hypothetical protein